jgi:hypothetical protein
MNTKFWLESLKVRDHSEDLGVGGTIILKTILVKSGFGVWTGFIWFRMGLMVGSCEYGNEPSGSIEGEEFYYLSVILAFQEGLCTMQIVT